LFLLAEVERDLGDAAAAEATLSRAIEIAADSRDAHTEAQAWVQLVRIAGTRTPSRVPDLVRGATGAVDRLSAPGTLRAALLTIQGSLAAEAGDYARAIELHEQSLEAWTAVSHDVDVELSRVHNNLGWTYHTMGRLEDARRHYESALALKEGVLGPGNPHLATTLHNLGMIAREQKEFATARSRLERALALTLAGVGEDHPRVANVLSELAGTLVDLGEPSVAIDAAERGLAILERTGDPDPALAADLRADLDRARAANGDP
jgi:tetratricopeptide (TPR) repeat protein